MDTYPLTPHRITEINREYATTIIQFGRGYEQRSDDGALPKIMFRVEHYALSNADIAALVAFFDDRRGSLRQFYFHNHHDGQIYTVRFAGKFIQRRRSAVLCDISMELVTC